MPKSISSISSRSLRIEYSICSNLPEYFVHHCPERPQRMTLTYPRLGRQITEHLAVLMIYPSPASTPNMTGLWKRSSFQQAARPLHAG